MSSILKLIALSAVLAVAGCATLQPVPLGTGDWVLAKWQGDDQSWYPAIVTDRAGNDLSLRYDDGDTGVQPVPNVRRFDWRAATRLECRYQGGPSWYPGRITEMASNRVNIHVRYDDGDEEDTTTAACRER